MKRIFWKTILLTCLIILTCGTANAASSETDAGTYIIRLADNPVASYRGGIPGLRATSPRTRSQARLNIRDNDTRAYRSYLSDKQTQVMTAIEAALGHPAEVFYNYDVTYNGLAIHLTRAEADVVAKLPEILSAQPNRKLRKMTNVSPNLVNAVSVWDGSGTGDLPGTKGEGIIIGVIDTGIWPEHPSFADDGSYSPPPTRWGGKCTPPADGTLGYTCNNKLIGIQYFLDGYVSLSEDGEYENLFYSGRDDDGHGTHVASTAAGNEGVSASIYGIDRGAVSGIAPRAHVASYKVGMTAADALAAIDKAVADGVDVINYSMGNDFDMNPWTDSAAQAFLAAREAGVFVAVSAGNGGPGESTIGSPGNAPWLSAVGAGYSDRLYLSTFEISDTDDDLRTLNFQGYGASSTFGIEDFRLVDAEGISDTEGDDSGSCIHPFPTGTFRSTDVVLCKRGDIVSWAKGNFVQDGGAGAMIIYEDEELYDFSSYPYPIPSLLISHKTGLEIKALAAQHPQLAVRFSQGEPVQTPDPRIPADTVAGFSARGPCIFSRLQLPELRVVSEIIDVIKPDLFAPGVHILAGASPEYADKVGEEMVRLGQQGELFQIIQGTSMSSPHVAGMAALLIALHPDWTPTEIQSALMITAIRQDQMARGEDADHPATPFDTGAGMADVSLAALAGFVLDESIENFRANNPEKGGDPSGLNLPGLTHASCFGECTWTRKVRGVRSGKWQAEEVKSEKWEVGSEDILTVEPSEFMLEPGETQEITITAHAESLPAGEWYFSELTFTPQISEIKDTSHSLHFPVALRPMAGSVPVESLTLETRRNQGTYVLEGVNSIATEDFTANVCVGTPQFSEVSLIQDSENEDMYGDLTDGVFFKLVDVPAGSKRLIVEITESTASDLDLFLGLDENGNGLPDEDEQICSSKGSRWKETCNRPSLGEKLETGTYWVLIQNWEGTKTDGDDITFSITLIGENDKGPITITSPLSVSFDELFDLEILWDVPEFASGDRLEAWIDIGTSAAFPDNIAGMPLTISRIQDDVSIESNVGEFSVHPGDTVTYTISVRPDEVQGDSLAYVVTSTLPDGMSYVPDSASIEPTEINGNRLIWRLESGPRYVMSTNRDDPWCGAIYGGYVDLENSGVLTNPDIHGNGIAFRFDDFPAAANAGTPISYFGESHSDGLWFTDDGIAFVGSAPENWPLSPASFPNPAFPNNLIAPFWRDLEVVYDAASNRGVSLSEQNGLMIIEYDDVEPAPAGSTDERFDFEILMRRSESDEVGEHEIMLAYKNFQGTYPAGVGIENADGTRGVQYAHNAAEIEDGLMICFDAVDEKDFEISYQVMIDEDIIPLTDTVVPPIVLWNIVEHALAGGQPNVLELSTTVTELPILSIHSGELGRSIPDEDFGGLASGISVSREVVVTDVNVTLSIDHPHVGDIRACLISPSGDEITLFENLSGTSENFVGTILDDGADTDIDDGDAPFTGSFRPFHSLSNFDGTIAQGMWILRIYDEKKWDQGTLISWGLEIEFTSPVPKAYDDTALTGWNDPVIIDVLANDEDSEGEPLRVTGVSNPRHGKVTHDGETITYTPEAEFVGEDSFTYTISDDDDGTAQARVRVTVTEAGFSVTVTTLSDLISSKDNQISLREALEAAETDQPVNEAPAGAFRDTILLPPGIFNMGKDGMLEITSRVNIIGDPDQGTILNGNGSDRVFHIHGGADVRLENLTIQNGGTPDTEDDDTESFPWVVRVRTDSDEGYKETVCGGSLIHPEWVLTTAHCASALGSSVSVMNAQWDSAEVDHIVIHPDFDEETSDSDVALLHLSEPLIDPTEQRSLRSPRYTYDPDTYLGYTDVMDMFFADLIPQGDPRELIRPGRMATLLTRNSQVSYSSEIYGTWITYLYPPDRSYYGNITEINIPLISNETANTIYEASRGSESVTDNMLVAGYELRPAPADDCSSFRGSPLMAEIETTSCKLTGEGEDAVPSCTSSSDFILIGMVSGESGCAELGHYETYTRLSQFTDWIYWIIDGKPVPSGMDGGGICNQGRLEIRNSAFIGNHAVRGGAIHNGGYLTLLNTTISQNTATLGGGICNWGRASLSFCTLSENSAKEGGGIYETATSHYSLFTSHLKSSLIAGNTAKILGTDIRGFVDSQGRNLIGDSLGGDGYGEYDMLDTMPLMTPLMDNGGPCLTYALQSDSPGVDAAGCTDVKGNKVETDARGAGRVSVCDIGAFEYDDDAYPPVAVDDVIFATETDESVSIDLLANDRDVNTDELTLTSVSEPSHGTIFQEDPEFLPHPLTYVPDAEFIGTDSLAYTISDGTDTSEAVAFVNVSADRLPSLREDVVMIPAGESFDIHVLANDRDPEGKSLSVTEVTTPENGNVVTDGVMVTYTPDFGFVGTDTFMYRATDGVKSDKASVTVIVEDMNVYHRADYDPRDYQISLTELLRVIQIYSNGAYYCGDPPSTSSGDGYGIGDPDPDSEDAYMCQPHDSDYNPRDWQISLNELLRLLQFYNALEYHTDEAGEDGFEPGGA